MLVALTLLLTACAGGRERALTPVVGEPIPVGDHPSAIAVTEDAVWVANQGDKTVSRIDPDTRQVVATIKIRLEPGSYQIPAPIDPKTGQVLAKVPESADVETLAAGEGGVWVLSRIGGGMRASTDKVGNTTRWPLGSISRIDPKTNRELAKITVGANPGWIAVGEGAVWVGNWEDGTISRIDPRTNQVVATIPVAAISEDKLDFTMAVGEGAVWIASWSRKEYGEKEIILTRLDPKTNSIIAAMPITRALLGFVAVGEGSVWVACWNLNTRLIPAEWQVGSVVRIDPHTNKIVATIPVPAYVIAASDRSVWITNYYAGTLIQIDAKTNTIVGEPIIVGTPAPSDFKPGKDECSGPNAIAIRKDTVWVALEGDDVIKPVMLVR